MVQLKEPDVEIDALAHAVIGASIEVHRQLGPGFLEQVYEEALCVELRLRDVPFQRQKLVKAEYKGVYVEERRLDLLVGKRLVVELKAVKSFAPIHRARVISYLKLTGHQLGLLINFNVPVLKEGVQRVILTR